MVWMAGRPLENQSEKGLEAETGIGPSKLRLDVTHFSVKPSLEEKHVQNSQENRSQGSEGKGLR